MIEYDKKIPRGGREVYKEVMLSGTCQAELNTEVRFCIAEARSSGIELIRLSPPPSDTEAASRRILNCLYKVLRAMMKTDRIQFFIPLSALSGGSTEAEFLLNKYSDLLPQDGSDTPSLIVKI